MKLSNNTVEIIEMLIKHFNYSIKDINSYEELTEEEKSFISKELFNKICKRR